jgi:hypothetical protein
MAQGPALERLVPLFDRTDPLADAVMADFAGMPRGEGFARLERALAGGVASVPEAPSSLRALFAEVDAVPRWVDRRRLDRGGNVVLRAGAAAGIVLGLKSLISGYASPAGNKPLVLSGRLQEQAPRRLAETSRFVQAVSRPGGMQRHGDGLAITLKVRLMHAQVRRLILASGRWQPQRWGAPLNQHDMLATVLLFSVALIDGLRRLGYDVGPEEAEDLMHLWRYVGLLLGVDEPSLPSSFAEGLRLARLIGDTQGEPDDDSRALVAALIDARIGQPATLAERAAAAARRHLLVSICRHLIGDAMADALALPRTAWHPIVAALRPANQVAARLNRLPLWRTLATLLGDRYWNAAISGGLGDEVAAFHPPPALVGGRS